MLQNIFSHRPPLWNPVRFFWSPRKEQKWVLFIHRVLGHRWGIYLIVCTHNWSDQFNYIVCNVQNKICNIVYSFTKMCMYRFFNELVNFSKFFKTVIAVVLCSNIYRPPTKLLQGNATNFCQSFSPWRVVGMFMGMKRGWVCEGRRVCVGDWYINSLWRRVGIHPLRNVHPNTDI